MCTGAVRTCLWFVGYVLAVVLVPVVVLLNATHNVSPAARSDDADRSVTLRPAPWQCARTNKHAHHTTDQRRVVRRSPHQQQVLTDILHAPATSPCARRTCVPLTVTLPLNFAVFLPMIVVPTLAAEWATVVVESRYYPWVGGLLFTLPVWRSPTQKLRAFGGAGDVIATRRLLRQHAAPAATAAAERGAAAAAALGATAGAAAALSGAGTSQQGAARSGGRRSSVRRGCRRACGCVPLVFACAGGAISYAVSVALVPTVALLDALCGTLPRAVAQARHHGDGAGVGLGGLLTLALLIALPRALLHAAFVTILALLGNLRYVVSSSCNFLVIFCASTYPLTPPLLVATH